MTMHARVAAADGTPPRRERQRHYASKAKIKVFVETARELGIKVGGFEVTPDGTIRILTAQAAAKDESADSAYDKWFNGGN